MEAAARELREESGAVDAAIQPLCDYRAGAAGDEANGMVFVAYFEHMEPLTHEIAEVRAFDTLPPPDRLTYPAITPLLYAEALAQKALGLTHVPAADRLRAAALSFWGAVLRQDAAALPGYFAENAVVRWPNTAERFTSAGYIRANCAYPGTWHGTVAVSYTHLTPRLVAGRMISRSRSRRRAATGRRPRYSTTTWPRAWQPRMCRALSRSCMAVWVRQNRLRKALC